MRELYSAAKRPRLPPRRVLRWVSVETRSAKANITSRRPSGVMVSQSAISPRVRPQPIQKPVSGSTTQIFMHGVSIEFWFNPFIMSVWSESSACR
jgi:hypothetical protein